MVKIDTYVTLNLTHVAGDLYKSKLIVPFKIRPEDRVMVALCTIGYLHESTEFINGDHLKFEFAIPKYTNPPGPGPGHQGLEL